MDGRNGTLGYMYGGLRDLILYCDAKRGSFPTTAALVSVPQYSSQRPYSVWPIVPRDK